MWTALLTGAFVWIVQNEADEPEDAIDITIHVSKKGKRRKNTDLSD